MTTKKWGPIIQSMSQGTFITGLGIIFIGILLPAERDDLIHGLTWTTASGVVYMLVYPSLRWFTMCFMRTKMKWRRFRAHWNNRRELWRNMKRWARYEVIMGPLQNALRGVAEAAQEAEDVREQLVHGDPPPGGLEVNPIKPVEFIKITLVTTGYKQTVVDGRLVRKPILNKEEEDGKEEPQQRQDGEGVANPTDFDPATFPRANQF